MYKAEWFIDLQIFLSNDASSEAIQTLQVSFIRETAMFALDELFCFFYFRQHWN